MHSLIDYALLGSLLTGAAGALILATVTVRHGLKTAAVLCFAVSAALGVMGLMYQTRAVPPAVARSDDGPLIDRLHALEKRLARAELDLQARGGSAPEWSGWEDRLARLESRVSVIEDRAAVAAHPAPAPPPRAVASAAPSSTPAKSTVRAKPAPLTLRHFQRVEPEEEPAAPAAPSAAPAALVTVNAPPVAAVAGPVTPAKPEPSDEGVSILERIRRDWEAVKSHARRGGDEWREGWDQIKRLFR